MRKSSSYNKLLTCGCFSKRRVAKFGRKEPLFIHGPSDGFGLTGFVEIRLCASLKTLGAKVGVLLGGRRITLSQVVKRNKLFGAGNIKREVLTKTVSAPICIVRATNRNNT